MLELILIITLAMFLGNIYQGEIIKKKIDKLKKITNTWLNAKKNTREYIMR